MSPTFPAMNEMMGWNVFSDIRLAIYSFSEMISGMILNVVMAISGVGLLGLAEWGRRLAVTVSWLKILRWVAMIVVTMVLILPITVQKVQKMTGLDPDPGSSPGQIGRSTATADADDEPDHAYVGCRRSWDDLYRPDRVDLPGPLDLVSDAAADARGLHAAIEAALGHVRDCNRENWRESGNTLVRSPGRHGVPPSTGAGWLIVVRSLLGLLWGRFAF